MHEDPAPPVDDPLRDLARRQAFPTLIGGGYSNSPSNVANLTATANGPSGSDNWQVTMVNTSGVTVAVTMYTVCAKG